MQAVAVVGPGDLVRHVLAGQLRQGLGRGQLHLHVDGTSPHIQGAAEDVGKAQDVVDLIGIVRTAGGDDGIAAHFRHLLGRDLRVRVGHGEDDRLVGHVGHHVAGKGALGRKPEGDVGAGQGLGQAARLGFHRMGRFPLVHAFRAALGR